MAKGFQFSPVLDALGGLGEIGGTGAAGAFEGVIEGKKLQSVLQSQAMQNQLREIQNLLMKGELARSQQPHVQVIGDRRIITDPSGRQTVENLPPTEVEAARIKREEEQARRLGAQAEQTTLDQQRGKALGPLVEKYMQALRAGDATAAQAALREIDETRKAFEKATTGGAKGAGSKPLVVGPGKSVWDPETQTFQTAPGAPPGQGSRVTTTDTTRFIPGKEITDTVELGQLRSALPQIVNEIAASPNIKGWMNPGPTVMVEGYPAPVRREDVIRHALKRRLDIDAQVRWDGKQWVLVKARIPDKREKLETTRKTGPAKSESTSRDDEDEE